MHQDITVYMLMIALKSVTHTISTKKNVKNLAKKKYTIILENEYRMQFTYLFKKTTTIGLNNSKEQRNLIIR